MPATKRRLFTPGPWKASNNLGCRTIRGDKPRGSKQTQYRDIAHTVGLADDAEDRGNAKLMAAAPTLLEFVRVLAGYGCAGVDQEPDATTLCGKCGPCEAGAFLRKLRLR